MTKTSLLFTLNVAAVALIVAALAVGCFFAGRRGEACRCGPVCPCLTGCKCGGK